MVPSTKTRTGWIGVNKSSSAQTLIAVQEKSSFSVLRPMRMAAKAIKAITAGLMPDNAAWTSGWLLYLDMPRQMTSIIMIVGSEMPMIEAMRPGSPAIRYPIKPAALTPIPPGAAPASAVISFISVSSSQCQCSTTSRSRTGRIA